MQKLIDALEELSESREVSFFLEKTSQGNAEIRTLIEVDGVPVSVIFCQTEVTMRDEYVANFANSGQSWMVSLDRDDAMETLLGNVGEYSKQFHKVNRISTELFADRSMKRLGSSYQVRLVGSQAEMYHLGIFFQNALQMNYGNHHWLTHCQSGAHKIGLIYGDDKLIGNFHMIGDDLKFVLGNRNKDVMSELTLYHENGSLYNSDRNREYNLGNIGCIIRDAFEKREHTLSI